MKRRVKARKADGAPAKVLITGASRGIGRALCQEAQRRGYEVHALVRKAADAPAGTVAHVADIRNRVVVRSVIDQLAPTLDVFIANAGIDAPAQWKDPTYADRAADVFDVNGTATAFSVYHLVHRWVTAGRKQGWITVISSLSAGRGLPRSGPYIATKTAQVVLCQSLERDLDRYDIGVSVVLPGFIDTEMSRELPRRPFLISPEDAARIIWNGLERGRFWIAFPRVTAAIMAVVNSLPLAVFRWIVILLQKWRLV